MNDCFEALEKSVISVFLDFSTAFGTVNCNILLKKLAHIGFWGKVWNWFKTYLTERKFYVDINNNYSETKISRMGVPQGSVIGPIMFLLYLNDLYHCSPNLSFTHFVDDTTIHASGRDIVSLSAMVLTD